MDNNTPDFDKTFELPKKKVNDTPNYRIPRTHHNPENYAMPDDSIAEYVANRAHDRDVADLTSAFTETAITETNFSEDSYYDSNAQNPSSNYCLDTNYDSTVQASSSRYFEDTNYDTTVQNSSSSRYFEDTNYAYQGTSSEYFADTEAEKQKLYASLLLVILPLMQAVKAQEDAIYMLLLSKLLLQHMEMMWMTMMTKAIALINLRMLG